MARDVMAVRLDRTTRQRLQGAARRRGLTPSAAARTALEQWIEAEERSEEARPYDGMADLLGSVGSGKRGRSSRNASGIGRSPRRRAPRRQRSRGRR